MTIPSDYDQYMLELMNRARLDQLDARQPLAFDLDMQTAAQAQVDWLAPQMIMWDFGSTVRERLAAAGYPAGRDDYAVEHTDASVRSGLGALGAISTAPNARSRSSTCRR